MMLWILVLVRYFFDRMALDEDGVEQAAGLGLSAPLCTHAEGLDI